MHSLGSRFRWGVLVLLILGGALMMFSGSAQANGKGVFQPYWTRSYQLYKQPHAIWLSEYGEPGVNLGQVYQVLMLAEKAQQTPEFVVYSIPLRDLGQSSVGGFQDGDSYLADNRLNASAIRDFVSRTGIAPTVYLEPDALASVVTLMRSDSEEERQEAKALYDSRTAMIAQLVRLYRDAGAKVYLDGANSAWFDYEDQDIDAIATILNQAGIAQAHGLVTNVSNRQALKVGSEQSEWRYLNRLLPRLQNQNLDVVVDTSRNGGRTFARQYYLAKSGDVIDNERPQGRIVGKWRQGSEGSIETLWIYPFWGEPKVVSKLIKREKYQFFPEKNILQAPPWLDPVGDVKLGPPPTNNAPFILKPYIHRFRYVKPPDDCDGSINCPPGVSKQEINDLLLRLQPGVPLIESDVWAR